jgi:hypothetical protein
LLANPVLVDAISEKELVNLLGLILEDVWSFRKYQKVKKSWQLCLGECSGRAPLRAVESKYCWKPVDTLPVDSESGNGPEIIYFGLSFQPHR